MPYTWKAIAATLNALPQAAREYIAELEKIRDPEGTVREITLLHDQVSDYRKRTRELEAILRDIRYTQPLNEQTQRFIDDKLTGSRNADGASG